MTSIENQRNGPARHQNENGSKERLEGLAHRLPSPVPLGFDPACISWVTDRIGITAVDGVDDALDEGFFVINVAEEIWNDANEKVSREPYSGTVLQALDEVDELVRRVLTTSGRKVVIHCAMHTYRASKIDDWRQFLGVTSRRHEHQSRYPVKKVALKHPILKGMPEDWVTPKDELYVIEKMWPKARALATSKSERDGKEYAVAWTNQYGKARVFGTTYGHSDATFSDPVFLKLVARGLLWASGELED